MTVGWRIAFAPFRRLPAELRWVFIEAENLRLRVMLICVGDLSVREDSLHRKTLHLHGQLPVRNDSPHHGLRV